ncbi:hypothetical protein [Sphingomonas sp. CROZ-RG-20F-R02-07]|uniref:hypothetical protein n=1 Tax=Sphingomonas sp. CROZ-RG-20F-R02-07 TaxID=2914832 RepID=UPI001F5ABFAE|nr:hypothetical protein [Sphingomonas sp. CROZ-RG-20F-R02-07]
MADPCDYQRKVAARQATMFDSFVGPGLHTTRAALAAASCVPASSLREYALGATMPLHVVLAIAPHLPAAAIDLLFEPAGKRLADRERSSTNWDEVAVETVGLIAEICDARADGVIDHREDASLRRRSRHLASKLTALGDDDDDR